jgi:hemerythrin-like domain-containing protein
MTAARLDLYTPIHKALRLFMTDTLQRVGQLDTDDASEFAATTTQVQALLAQCRAHLAHENQFVHTALEARRPGASARIAGEHDEHLETIAALEAELAALRALPSGPGALRLYRQLALFVAHNFEHMHHEETQHNAALWALYSDAELQDVEARLVASIRPDEMAAIVRWLVPAMSPSERVAMLLPMQQQMPPEAMRGLLDIARPHLGPHGWDKLARALGIPAAATACA